MAELTSPPGQGADDLSLYAGRWVACLGERVVGQGGTPEQALRAAQSSRFKETPQVFYVPTAQPFSFHPIFDRLLPALPPSTPVYLVGGAVRDALLARPSHDLDFALPENALPVARQVANAIGGAFYPLDEARNYGRVVFTAEDGARLVIDFSVYQGPDLESDLRGRDFTVNAMAVEVHQRALFDPLGGAVDLRARQLRACSPEAFIADPIRVLRGIRLAAAFDFHILPETRQLMRQATHLIPQNSPERLRDELFRILEGPRPAAALRGLDILGALAHVLPELSALKGVEQPEPHFHDVWNHTLEVLNKLSSVLDVLARQHNPEIAASMQMGQISLRLGRYREQTSAHLAAALTQERSLRALLFLAALYHDIAKPETRTVDDDGRIRFLDHDQAGAEIAGQRAYALQLSNAEIARLKTIIRHHMRPLYLTNTGRAPTRRAIYRFFRDAGLAGVDICLLSLADVLATYGPTLPQEHWENHIAVVRTLLSAWWEQPTESVSPPALVSGHDLIAELGLPPGPLVGELLEAIREAQATGQIQDRRAALSFASRYISRKDLSVD